MSVLPSVIGALGALGSGLLTSDSINNQNAIAQSQFRENMAFQRYQYEDMKRYQSPVNQVRMLKEAGINPALALNSSLAGSSLSSVGGVSPTSSMVAQDYSSLPSAASNLIGSLNQNELVESEQAKNFADAAKTTSENVGQMIENAYKHGDKKLAQNLLMYQGRIAEQQFAFDAMTIDRRVEAEQFKTTLLMSQAEAQAIATKHLDEKYSKEFGLLLAQTAAAYASQRLSDEQAAEVLQRKIASYGLDKRDAHDLFDSSIDLVESQAMNALSSALSSADGDMKSNPFTLNIRAYDVGTIHNRINALRDRQNFRRRMRELRKYTK